ncbi:hypothetical protein R0K18_15195 [Pantoea sp. SIMBA_133]
MINVRLLMLLGVYVMSAGAASAETFLPQHDITLSGRIVAPSCQAQLDTNKLTFLLSKKGEPRRQTISLTLSECDISGLGIRFGSTVQTQHPERGVLKDSAKRPASDIWFTVGPVFRPEEKSLFSLATDSTDLVKGDGNTLYFKLGGQNYWFEVDESTGGQTLNFPFEVLLHRKNHSQPQNNDNYSANFALQLSYR